MIIYFILLFVVVLAAHLAEKYKTLVESRLFIFVVFTSMVLVAGLRDRTVGTDSGSYVKCFKEMLLFSDVKRLGEETREYGFWIFTWIVRSFSDQYSVFFIATALIVVGCYLRSIVRYSSNWTISCFVFITMGFYTFFFNVARQGIACAIYVLAIGPLLKRNLKAYLGYVLLAFLFHKTAIMMLPVYFVFDKTNTIKKNLIIFLAGFAGMALFQFIAGLGSQVDERYAGYGDAGEGGGYFMIGLTAVLGLFFFMFKKHVHTEKDRYELFLNMFLFGAMISLLSALMSVNPNGFLRFSFYLNISAIFLWPIIFKNLINRSSRLFVSYLFLTCHLLLFFLTTERFSNLIPYTFNTDLSALLPFGG